MMVVGDRVTGTVTKVGFTDGFADGDLEGFADGDLEGLAEGDANGDTDGAGEIVCALVRG